MKKLAKGQAQSQKSLTEFFQYNLSSLRWKEESKAWGSELSYLKKGHINRSGT